MITLAFKKAKGDGFVARTIDLLSGRQGYCHVEIIFSDGMSFSSTTLDDGPDGVRFRRINYSHPKRWTFYRVPVSAEQEARIRAKAEQLVGAPYDYWGVLRFVLPFAKEHPTAYFCSEVCLEAMQAGPRFLELGEPWRVPPNLWAAYMAQVSTPVASPWQEVAA